MKTYNCKVWNRKQHFIDTYWINADSVIDAYRQLIKRLDEETDEGSEGYEILGLTRIVEE